MASADRHRLDRSRSPTTTARHRLPRGLAARAFGEDALKLKRGELALVLDGARVRVVEVRRAPKAAAAS